jgi:hypothetical protein
MGPPKWMWSLPHRHMTNTILKLFATKFDLGWWNEGGIFNLSYWLDEVPPKLNFILFHNHSIWLAHHYEKYETMEAPQNRRFYFEV